MSSSKEPYKSRLFNFLNRQTINFQDKLGITVRNLRSTTEMGIQLLLYPFYLMVQSGRVTRRQLESRVQSSLLLTGAKTSKSDSSVTTASVPLNEVLNLVEPWLDDRENIESIEAETIDISTVNEVSDRADPWFSLSTLAKRKTKQPENSSQLENIQTRFSPLSPQSSLEIQGIASLLDSHEIVLVDYHNRILNVLNSRQQEILQQYLAQRHQNPNQLITTAHKVLASLPHISTKNSAKSAPIKFVWKTLDWLQTSPVAKKVNLFGESQLASSSPVLPPSSTSSFLPNFLVSLDNKVADLETKSLLSTSVSTNDLDTRSSLSKFPTNLAQSQQDLTTNPFQIRAIISAAIEHFFGTDKSKAGRKIQGSSNKFTLPNSASNIPLESKTASSYLPGNSLDLNLPEAKEQESWLSWNDIFSNTITSTVQPENSTPTQQSSQPLSLSSDKTEDFTSITNASSPDTELETASDLLETKATTVGYEKHPLERALEILDAILVWLEEKLLKIWQRFKPFS